MRTCIAFPTFSLYNLPCTVAGTCDLSSDCQQEEDTHPSVFMRTSYGWTRQLYNEPQHTPTGANCPDEPPLGPPGVLTPHLNLKVRSPERFSQVQPLPWVPAWGRGCSCTVLALELPFGDRILWWPGAVADPCYCHCTTLVFLVWAAQL